MEEKIPTLVFEALFPMKLNIIETNILKTARLPDKKKEIRSEKAAYACYLIAQLSAKNKREPAHRLAAGTCYLGLSECVVAEMALLCGDDEVFKLTQKKSLDSDCLRYSSGCTSHDFVFDAFLRNNNLERLEYFFKHLELGPETLIKFYRKACRCGNLACLKLIEKVEGFDKKEAIQGALGFNGFMSACLGGSLEVVKYLLASEDFDLGTAIRKKTYELTEYAPYSDACSSGNLELVRYLESTDTFDIKKAIAAGEFKAFRSACQSGNLDLVKHLEKSAGCDKESLYKPQNYMAFKKAFVNNKHTVLMHLLEQIDCFRFVSKQLKIYQYLLDDFINDKFINEEIMLGSQDTEYKFLLLRLLIERQIRYPFWCSYNYTARDSNKITRLLKNQTLFKYALKMFGSDVDLQVNAPELAQFSRRFIEYDRETATKLLKIASVMPDYHKINVTLTSEEEIEKASNPNAFFVPPKEAQDEKWDPDYATNNCSIL